MYPNYTARIQLEKWYKDVFVPKPEIADILPVPYCKRPMMIGDKPQADDTTGQAVKNEDGCNAIIIRANTPGNPNGHETTGSGDNGRNAPFSPSGGGTVAGMGGSAVATGSMTNILALDTEGQVVAILMINTMPSWQRPDEGKVEIHNLKGNLVLLSQKVATNDEENHLFGKIHFSDGSAENGSAKIE